MYSPPTSMSLEKFRACAIERITWQFLRMHKTTFRQRLRAARYLEEQRRILKRVLGDSKAVDVALANNIPAGDLRRWFKRMSHKRSRMRLVGVSHADVIKYYRKATISEVRQNPLGPWKDFQVAVALVSRQPQAVQYLPDFLRDNDKIIQTAIIRDGSLIQWASQRLRADPDIVIDAVQGGDGPTVLQHVPTELRANRMVVLAAVEANGHSIQYGNQSFYDDEEIIMAASFDFPALTLASRRIQENRAFIRDICMRCRAGMVGPNLMSFLEDTPLLNNIGACLPTAIILCRIRLMSGKGVLTSFSTKNCVQDWRRNFLGLHVLFDEDPQHIEGYTICNGAQREMENWAVIEVLWHDSGLKLQELNEVTLVRTAS